MQFCTKCWNVSAWWRHCALVIILLLTDLWQMLIFPYSVCGWQTCPGSADFQWIHETVKRINLNLVLVVQDLTLDVHQVNWLLAHQQTRPSFPCWKVESTSNYINGPLSHSQSSPSETLKHNLLIECQEISKRSAILATPRILWTPGMGGEWQGAGWGKVTVIHIFHIILCPK